MFRGDHWRHPAFYVFRRETIKPKHLQQQLVRSFGVRLTNDESDCLVKYLDKRRRGVVDCEVFLKYFWLFGRTHRRNADQTEREKNRRGEKRRQDEIRRHLRRFAHKPPADMRPCRPRALPPGVSESSAETGLRRPP